MAYLSPDTLLDGALRTLREAVLPAVHDRFARGQLFAVLDVLHNLRDRIEFRAAVATAEAESAEAALRAAAALLEGEARAVLETALAGAPAGPPAERAAALRAAVVTALAVVAGLPPAAAAAARAPIDRHLAAQALRDVMPLKPSLLEEISKG